jgi:ribosomal protein L37AE/L43A
LALKRWVTIAEYPSIGLADVARTKLESEGIPAFVPQRHLRTVYGGGIPGGYELQVGATQVEAAKSILEGFEADFETEDAEERPVCPQCSSDLVEIDRSDEAKWIATCRSCKYRWTLTNES